MTFPLAAMYRQTFTYRDAKGQLGKMRFYLLAGGAATPADLLTQASALSTAIAAASNAHLQSAQGPLSEFGTVQYGASGAAYQDCPQKAVLVMQDAAGSLHRFMIPAPKLSLFLADGQTIDPAQVVGAGKIATVLLSSSNGAIFTDRSGNNQLVNFMGGYYRAAKIPKRVNVLTLTPSLTGGEPAE